MEEENTLCLFRLKFTYFGTMTFKHVKFYRLICFTSTPVSQICIPPFSTEPDLLRNDDDVWTNSGKVVGQKTPLKLMHYVVFYKSHAAQHK